MLWVERKVHKRRAKHKRNSDLTVHSIYNLMEVFVFKLRRCERKSYSQVWSQASHTGQCGASGQLWLAPWFNMWGVYCPMGLVKMTQDWRRSVREGGAVWMSWSEPREERLREQEGGRSPLPRVSHYTLSDGDRTERGRCPEGSRWLCVCHRSGFFFFYTSVEFQFLWETW